MSNDKKGQQKNPQGHNQNPGHGQNPGQGQHHDQKRRPERDDFKK